MTGNDSLTIEKPNVFGGPLSEQRETGAALDLPAATTSAPPMPSAVIPVNPRACSCGTPATHLPHTPKEFEPADGSAFWCLACHKWYVMDSVGAIRPMTQGDVRRFGHLGRIALSICIFKIVANHFERNKVRAG